MQDELSIQSATLLSMRDELERHERRWRPQALVEPGELTVRAAVDRVAVHETITESQISRLVEAFYADVWADERLGPIFSARVADRNAHLIKMKTFWSSVLLKTGRYKGRPMPAHVKLSEVEEQDFERWLGLFRKAVTAELDHAAVEPVMNVARRIAQSFWLAMFGGLMGTLPDWSDGPAGMKRDAK